MVQSRRQTVDRGEITALDSVTVLDRRQALAPGLAFDPLVAVEDQLRTERGIPAHADRHNDPIRDRLRRHVATESIRTALEHASVIPARRCVFAAGPWAVGAIALGRHRRCGIEDAWRSLSSGVGSGRRLSAPSSLGPVQIQMRFSLPAISNRKGDGRDRSP
jgi:hypothetical protein